MLVGSVPLLTVASVFHLHPNEQLFHSGKVCSLTMNWSQTFLMFAGLTLEIWAKLPRRGFPQEAGCPGVGT